MPVPTASTDHRRRRHVVSLRLNETEFRHLRNLAHMGRCGSPGDLLRRLLDQAHEQMIRDLARW